MRFPARTRHLANFAKRSGSSGRSTVLLGGVVVVVEADADDLARLGPAQAVLPEPAEIGEACHAFFLGSRRPLRSKTGLISAWSLSAFGLHCSLVERMRTPCVRREIAADLRLLGRAGIGHAVAVTPTVLVLIIRR
jgi:hypothetical protein